MAWKISFVKQKVVASIFVRCQFPEAHWSIDQSFWWILDHLYLRRFTLRSKQTCIDLLYIYICIYICIYIYMYIYMYIYISSHLLTDQKLHSSSGSIQTPSETRWPWFRIALFDLPTHLDPLSVQPKAPSAMPWTGKFSADLFLETCWISQSSFNSLLVFDSCLWHEFTHPKPFPRCPLLPDKECYIHWCHNWP